MRFREEPFEDMRSESYLILEQTPWRLDAYSLPLSWGVFVIGEGLSDHAAGSGGEHRVGVLVIR